MNILFIDVETTGFSKNAAVIEIAAIPMINGEIKQHFQSYIKPHEGATIEPKALEVNKISAALLPTFSSAEIVIDEFVKFIDSFECPFVIGGHNAQFDRDRVHSLFSRHQRYTDYVTRFSSKTICTMEMAKSTLKGKFAKFGLKDLCDRFDIKLENAHSALYDIKATAALYDTLKSMEAAVLPRNENLSYQDKKKKYFDSRYIQINADGTVYITNHTMNNPEAVAFIFSELWGLYGN